MRHEYSNITVQLTGHDSNAFMILGLCRRAAKDAGLSQKAGLALLQDPQRYFLIGTHDRLNRYHGYTITPFHNHPHNPPSLGHHSVLPLYEDAPGHLWIGTWGGGLINAAEADGEVKALIMDACHRKLEEGSEQSLEYALEEETGK